ncbi:MAG TPA: amidohydrolase family protein [Cyclobacteriaceae bacterium]|nr:amidohydrolase [Cyclobacteriaceae bacterium]HMV09969.1 amidohydrolase family protein [Cyclobacteriaceae bacterium]HMV89807.1 amidohydrolase family protein [Cyclobacteriaceae bacterium]HMX01592.1 amidohydrolase family protein [Cyclobacteriaceae bacterium]HMX50714.1 amidohydrolase family protein [Cyclobacteriaceae bacterium]
MLKIDTHTHILPRKLPNWSEKFGYGDFIYLQHHKKGAAKMMRGNQFFREIQENSWNPEVRIKEYAKFRTQVQVVCTVPVMFSYWARPLDCLDVSRYLNDDIAELIVKYPKNYLGLGTIPMQDTELAIQELERCKEIGLSGIQIGSNINDLNLNEERFFPIFEACEKLSMAVLVHPWNMMGEKNIQRYWLPWLVGMPAETARAICSMIFAGIFEKLPNLRVNFAHAGGSFLSTIGRIQHGFECRPDLVAIDNNIGPKHYLGKFWVDSITHDPLMLDYVLKLQGSKKITLGTDYPFPLGDLEVGKFIEDMNIDSSIKEDIFCNAPLEWLGVSKERFI